MDLKGLFITMGILGLTIFSILSFIVQTQEDNSVSSPITNNSIINDTFTNLEESISSSESQSQTASDAFGSITPTEKAPALEFKSIISPTKIAKTVVIGFWNIFIVLPVSILGVSPLVIGLLNAILLVTIIILIWAVRKGVIAT